MRWIDWRLALRIARREAMRARGRSALIVAMIALPILALTAADVLARSAQLEPGERVARALGSTQARLDAAWTSGRPVLQAPHPDDGNGEATAGPNAEAPETPADIESAVPSGYRVLTSQESMVKARTRAGIASIPWTEVKAADPAFRGRFDLLSGVAPDRPGEVAVTSELFAHLQIEVGGTVQLTDPSRTVTVTAVVDRIGYPGLRAFWALPGELPSGSSADPSQPSAFLVGDRPVTWADVQALNEAGVLVTSRQVLLDPPPDSAVPYYAEYGKNAIDGGELVVIVLGLAVVVVLAGLEVTLLAGAAFAVGARRQARSLGLVAATGGTSGQVRRIVLAGGLVLGVAGAVAGVLLGLLLGWVAQPVLTDVADADFGHFDVNPLELAAIALLGVTTGLLAAVLPARTAARQDPVVALTGRRGIVRTPKKVPAIGLVLTATGVGSAALGSSLAVTITSGADDGGGSRTWVAAALIAGGAALAQIGLIITSPAIIGAVGRLAGRLPLPARLALRDAARHRGRSAPAMAAVLTAVTGSMALLLYVTSLDARDRDQYTASWPEQSAGVVLNVDEFVESTRTVTTTRVDPDRVVNALRGHVPAFETNVLTTNFWWSEAQPGTYAGVLLAPGKECFLWSLVGEPTDRQRERAAADPRCRQPEDGFSMGFGSGGIPVGDERTLRLVAGGTAPPDAVKILQAGGVVVFDRNMIADDGTVLLEVTSSEPGSVEPQTRQVTLPGAYVKVTEPLSSAVYSTQAARQLGLSTAETLLLLRFEQLPTPDHEEAANAALQEAGLTVSLDVERGYQSAYGLGILSLMVGAAVITLGAAGIATGLAQADARADHATLAAVGAAPRLRKTLAAAQAMSIALLGAALGIAAGFVPAAALIGAVSSLDLVVPWGPLLTVLLGIPLLAGAAAWLFTRSRVPLERRVA